MPGALRFAAVRSGATPLSSTARVRGRAISSSGGAPSQYVFGRASSLSTISQSDGGITTTNGSVDVARRQESRRLIQRALGISSMRAAAISDLDERLLRRFWWLCFNAFSGIGVMIAIQQVCWDPVLAVCYANTGFETLLKCVLTASACVLVYQLLDCQRLQAQINALEQGRLGEGILVRDVGGSGGELDREQAFLQHVLRRVGSFAVILFGRAVCGGRETGVDAASSFSCCTAAAHGVWHTMRAFFEYLCCVCCCCGVDTRASSKLDRQRWIHDDDHQSSGELPMLPQSFSRRPTVGRAQTSASLPSVSEDGGDVSSNGRSSSASDYAQISERVADTSSSDAYIQGGGGGVGGKGASAQTESWRAEIRSNRMSLWLQLVLCFFHLPPWLSGGSAFDNKFGLFMLLRAYLALRLLHFTSPLYRQRLSISRALLRSFASAGGVDGEVPTGVQARNALPRFGWQLSLKLSYSERPWSLISTIALVTILLSGYSLHILERGVQANFFGVPLSGFPPPPPPTECTVLPSAPVAPNTTALLGVTARSSSESFRVAVGARSSAAARSTLDKRALLSSVLGASPGADTFSERVAFGDRFFGSLGGLVVSLFVTAQCLFFLWPSDVYAIWQPSLMSSKLLCMLVSAVGLVLTTLLIGLASLQLLVRHVEEGAMRYVRLGDSHDELRHAAACIIQLAFRSRRRQRALLTRIRATRAALVLRIQQQQVDANQRSQSAVATAAAVTTMSPSASFSLAARVQANSSSSPSDAAYLSRISIVSDDDAYGTSTSTSSSSSSSSSFAAPSAARVTRRLTADVSDSDEDDDGDDTNEAAQLFYLNSDLRLLNKEALLAALDSVSAALVEEQCTCVQEMILCRQRFQRARRRLIDLEGGLMQSLASSAGERNEDPSVLPPASPAPAAHSPEATSSHQHAVASGGGDVSALRAEVAALHAQLAHQHVVLSRLLALAEQK